MIFIYQLQDLLHRLKVTQHATIESQCLRIQKFADFQLSIRKFNWCSREELSDITIAAYLIHNSKHLTPTSVALCQV